MRLGVQGIKSIFKRPDLGLLILRAATGSILAVHGWNKFSAGKEVLQMIGSNVKYVGIHIGSEGAVPLFFGIMAAGSELIGGALLVLGFLFRTSASFIFFTMLVATLYKYQSGSGALTDFGYPMIMMFVALGLLFTGPGRFSVQSD